MRIVLDAMGSDDCPGPEVQAAVEAARQFGDEIILVGPAERLKPMLAEAGGDAEQGPPGGAPDIITMEDKGLKLALKAKRRARRPPWRLAWIWSNGEADAFVTAGNTGGALATAYYRLGTIPGVERPALTGLFPVKGGYCVVLDIGANPECKPEPPAPVCDDGRGVCQTCPRHTNPRVGLLSNGEEAGKGNELVKGTYPLLEASGLNFIGNVEGKELFGGRPMSSVTDGFTGNILLKSSEAVAKLIVDVLRQELMSSTAHQDRRAVGKTGLWQDQADARSRRGRRGAAAGHQWAGVYRPRPLGCARLW